MSETKRKVHSLTAKAEKRAAIYENRANLTKDKCAENDATRENQCDCCSESMIFAFKDAKGHEFSIGLLTILECLALAERAGAVPELSSEWWSPVALRYDVWPALRYKVPIQSFPFY